MASPINNLKMMAERSTRLIAVFSFCAILCLSSAHGAGDRSSARLYSAFGRALGFCTTPDKVDGICKPISECSPLRTMMSRLPPMSSAFLRQSLCGYTGQTPIVCCPISTPTQPPYTNENSTQSAERNAKMGLMPPKNECGEDNAWAILEGTTFVVNRDLPWMALLQYRNSQGNLSFNCGGVLINNRYILTAAHCIKPTNNLHLVSVRLGEHDTGKSMGGHRPGLPFDVPVEKAIGHPKYSKSPNHYNDMALLRLNQNVEFRLGISPICLPLGEMKYKPFDGGIFQVAGWGKTHNNTGSEEKKSGYAPFVEEYECKRAYQNMSVRINGNLQICASPSRKGFDDVCSSSDSGGPLMGTNSLPDSKVSRFYVYGVMAFDFDACRVPGVFTRVTSYVDWILDTIEPGDQEPHGGPL